MTIAFIDTETTGLEPIDSGAFEIAIIVYGDTIEDGKKIHKMIEEKVFRLNPLDDEVLYHESAGAVHGISKEEIESFPPAVEVIPELVTFLKKHCPEEKLIFAGYKCKFDYGHISALLFRHGGYLMQDYFNGRLIDVYEKVKQASEMGLLPKTRDQKLETMTKALDIPHEGAHSALADIRATRRLYEMIWHIQNKGKR
jgi:DNA polymerase III epsilon subunit-like protein